MKYKIHGELLEAVYVYKENRTVNLVLGGGGIKGIAYAGVLKSLETLGLKCGNIAGVSAGALVGAYIGAGCNAYELGRMLDEFDFNKINIGSIPKNVPAVSKYLAFRNTLRQSEEMRWDNEKIIEYFLDSPISCGKNTLDSSNLDFAGYRGSFLKNIITLSKEGCLCDGDYLEEWVYKTLLKKGIKTFDDLRGGAADIKNPDGYRVRMTAVDANRAKVIVLPDDIEFYGVRPGQLEVCRAVRMSASVPFAFKPVEIKKYEGKSVRKYHIVDGGVLDGFPSWIMDTSYRMKILGFTLAGSSKKKLLSVDTPLNILKALIAVVHDIGVDKNAPRIKYLADIDTGNVSYLDFDLSKDEKQYLYNSGKQAAEVLIGRYKNDIMLANRGILGLLSRIFRGR